MLSEARAGVKRDSPTGKYIYCITEGAADERFGPLGIGGRGDEVYTIGHNGLAAVVSDSPAVRYPVSRENCFAHERAIEAVFKRHPVLPVRFCTIAGDESTVRSVLEREHAEFTELLGRMRDKVEVGVKAIFHETLIYEQILDRGGDLRRRKEALASLPPHQAYWQLVEIGKMVEDALEAEKVRVREEITAALNRFCHDIRLTHRLLGERMIMNAAFLVGRDQEAAFDREMDRLANRYGQQVMFRYVSGFPPFNFVCLTINVDGRGTCS